MPPQIEKSWSNMLQASAGSNPLLSWTWWVRGTPQALCWKSWILAMGHWVHGNCAASILSQGWNRYMDTSLPFFQSSLYDGPPNPSSKQLCLLFISRLFLSQTERCAWNSFILFLLLQELTFLFFKKKERSLKNLNQPRELWLTYSISLRWSSLKALQNDLDLTY